MNPFPDPSPSVRFLLAPLALAWLLATGSVAAQTAAPAAAAPAASAASGPSLRAEVAKPLVAAQEAIKAGQYADALARVAEAEAIAGLTPYEQYIVLRLKAPAVFGGGDQAGALALFEQVIVSPLLPAAEKPPLTETAIKLALQLKQYDKAAALMKAYLADGGANPELARLYPQVLSVVGDHAGVIAQLQPQLTADAAAKRATPEATLRLLAGSQNAVKDSAGYLATLQQLAGSTGKAEYWSELITRTVRRDGFADDRLRLDVYRLRRAVGQALNAGELGDMAFRANQIGLPTEAQLLLDEGFGAGLLGKDANAEADRKLRESATKAAAQDRASIKDSETGAARAKDGNAAAGLALALSALGEHDRALALMAQARTKGGLRRPDESQLHQGVVQWRAGKIDDAKASFAAVKGSEGTADLAQLWLLFLNSPARK